MSRTPLSLTFVALAALCASFDVSSAQIAGLPSPTPSVTGIPGGTGTATITVSPGGGTPTITVSPGGGTPTSTVSSVTPTGSPAGTTTATVTATGGASTATPSGTGGVTTPTQSPGVGTPTATPVTTASAAATRTPSSTTPARSPTPVVIHLDDDGCQIDPTAGAAWPLLLAPVAFWLRRRRAYW